MGSGRYHVPAEEGGAAPGAKERQRGAGRWLAPTQPAIGTGRSAAGLRLRGGTRGRAGRGERGKKAPFPPPLPGGGLAQLS